MRRNHLHRQDGAYEFNDTALAAKRVQVLAFISNFVNRSMKPPIIIKKPHVQLKVPAVPSFFYYLLTWPSAAAERHPLVSLVLILVQTEPLQKILRQNRQENTDNCPCKPRNDLYSRVDKASKRRAVPGIFVKLVKINMAVEGYA